MAITMQDIFYKAMALIDNYTDDGQIYPTEDTIDLQTKSILLADMAQKELYSVAKIQKTFQFSQKPIPNLLGNSSEFNQVDFIGTDQTYPNDGVIGAKAYYFEATGTGTVYIEEYNGVAWNTLSIINVPAQVNYNAYKGVIVATDTSYPIRLRFSGTTWYRHVNRALFGYPFAVSQIPDYRPYVRINLPADFMDTSQLVSESIMEYNKDSDYKWEEPNNLYVSYYFDASYRLIYNPVPVTVTSINDTLECNNIIGQAIPYYVAAKLAPFENQSLVNFYEQKYQELKMDAKSKKPVTWETVQSTYHIGGGYYGNL